MELHNYTTVKIKSWNGQDGVTWIEPEVNSGHIIAKIVSGNDLENARRLVAAWNYCHGVPTAELESKGADAGFWGRACSRLETKNEKLEAQNAALLAAVKEMERMLPVVEYLQISRLWDTANQGENASLENYRATLEKALEAVKNQTT